MIIKAVNNMPNNFLKFSSDISFKFIFNYWQSDNNTSDLNTGLEPKEDIKITPDYNEKEPIFWHVFEELSNHGNGLVDYYNLQERLLSTGKFYAGDAVLMIEHMEKSGKIEQTGDYHVYRKKSASPE
jgi:hypothetical protein